MEQKIRYVLIAMIMITTGGCETGVDKDRPEPEPAVGRTFERDDAESTESDSSNTEASYPIRNTSSDSAK